MPRQARIDAPGALHHIIIRGIERRHIFQDDKDRESFLDRFGDVLNHTSTSCYAWALIPNHIHLLLRTGTVPIARIMRRLLTGYAVTYNRRHRRHGQLFQNRYKSILCQEDRYLLELVRYIHLNPLRAKLVENVSALATYPYSGHSVILGKRKEVWQDVNYLLGFFGKRVAVARKKYEEYLEEGFGLGRRSDLIGGGLIRSMGGWSEVKRMRIGKARFKGDERILGDTEFVMEVLKECEESFERKYELRNKGYDIERLASRVSSLFEIAPEDIYSPGKYKDRVKARSVLCYWAVRELGETQIELARKLGIKQPAVSAAVKRGEKLAKEMDLEINET